MKSILRGLLLAVLLLSAVSPMPAHAFLNTVNFMFWYTDPVAGASEASGWFSFDSGILPASPGWFGPVADPWAISFTFGGHSFTTSDAGLHLETDGAGTLTGWSLFSNPNTTAIGPGFVLDAALSQAPWGEMRWLEANYWLTPNPPHVDGSTGRWSLSVPEPAALPLLGFGLSLVGLARRSRR